jgi:hypothetical protein
MTHQTRKLDVGRKYAVMLGQHDKRRNKGSWRTL